MQLKARPCVGTLTWYLCNCTCCVYIACFDTALVYTIWLHCCCCYCILCLPAAADFYIVVSQDVETVAVVLEMHPCVGRDQQLCCLLFPPRHQHILCTFILIVICSHCMYFWPKRHFKFARINNNAWFISWHFFQRNQSCFVKDTYT